jgi:competence protein ComEA
VRAVGSRCKLCRTAGPWSANRYRFVTKRSAAVVKIDDIDSFFTPARRRLAAAVAVALVAVVLLGRHLLHGRGPGPSPGAAAAVDVAPPAPRTVVVHVVGAVRRAGLYHLRAGARIADAVRRAGGATRRADLEAINLAAPLEDGLQVVVPRKVAVPAPGSAAAPGEAAQPAGPVHLNTATLEQLDALPGIGPVTAQKILDWRQKHGAFTSVDDLDAVPGIGPARLEQLRDLVAP